MPLVEAPWPDCSIGVTAVLFCPDTHSVGFRVAGVALQAIVLQGIVGCFPWQAMVFFTLWLQLTGFSDSTASLLVAAFGAGVAGVRHMLCSYFGTLGSPSKVRWSSITKALRTLYSALGKQIRLPLACSVRVVGYLSLNLLLAAV